ncbi:MAG: hypothetical protein IPH64_12475 [Comamonadaceae bacterium]|nr:hypothetical protein [Comamonadaceae bacterium]
MAWGAVAPALASIGIGPGKTFEFKDLSLEHKAAVLLAMKEGDGKITRILTNGMKNINGWKVGAMFGDRGFFNSDWPKQGPGRGGGGGRGSLWPTRHRPSCPPAGSWQPPGLGGDPAGREPSHTVRRSRRRILPTVDLGSVSRKTTVLGTL